LKSNQGEITMTLETLAKDIAKSAEAEASAMVKAANEEARGNTC